MISWGLFPSGCIQGKNALPVGSPNYSGIAEMNINAKHTLLIFAEMIFNDFKRSFSIHSSHWGDVSHGGQHRNATVFDLGGATSLEVLHTSIGGKAGGIPKSDRGLNAQLIFECAQRRCGVVGPVTPGASCETILLTVIGTDSRAANYFFSLLERHATNSQRHMWTYV